MEERWQELAEFWERMRWARAHFSYKRDGAIFRPTDAARTLGVPPVTYRTWEQAKADGGRIPPLETIQAIAEKFGVSWVWLASGQGSPYFDPRAEEQFNAFARRLPEVPEERREDAFAAMRAVLESFARRAG